MRGLCGWFTSTAIDDAPRALAGMWQAGTAASGTVGVADVRQHLAPQAAMAVYGTVARPVLVEAGELLVALAGHPRLIDGGERAADPGRIAEALQRRGTAALPDIGGDFAIAVWNAASRSGFIAVDRIGVQPLVYARQGQALAFASTLDALGGFPGVQRRLSDQGLFDYVYHHVCPGPRTIYDGLLRVPPGCCVEFDSAGMRDPRPYWTMRFEDRPRPFADLKRDFVGLLEGAVREAADAPDVGAFLSGGTDSSTVSGMLARARSGTARTFSIGFDAAGYDEMEYARIAAKHFKCEHNEYYVTPKDVVDAVPRIAALYDQPFGNASAIPTYHCARFAHERGVRRLLAGDGGDELFGGNERYAKYYLLGLYDRIPGWLKAGLVEPLFVSAPLVGTLPLLKKVRSYILQARPPMPQRYASYNLVNHLGARNIFTADFLSKVDADHGAALLAEAHAPYAGASLVNQMLGIDLRFILADGDLPKVTRMCELAGVDVTFPLLDDRIIEFSRCLESDFKLRRTSLRWFFKEALNDFLPQEIITKQKHGFGLPVGTWLVNHAPLLELARSGVEAVARRGLVQRAFVDELFDRRLREHAAYFGTMAWVLMMLGLWLDSRKL